MWPRIVAGIFIPVGNHYFQALASTLQFVAQVCDRLWLVPATDRAFAYITYMSPPHVALMCSGPPQKRDHLWLKKVASVLGPLDWSATIKWLQITPRMWAHSCRCRSEKWRHQFATGTIKTARTSPSNTSSTALISTETVSHLELCIYGQG